MTPLKKSDISERVRSENRRPAIGLLLVIGLSLVALGLYLLPTTRWWHSHLDSQYKVIGVRDKPSLGDVSFPSFFPLERLTEYRVGLSQGLDIPLAVAEYHNKDGAREHAIVYPDIPQGVTPTSTNPRMKLWESGAQAITKHASANSLFFAWWDNAQRIHFLAGQATWSRLPAAAGFKDVPLREFWGLAAGGFAKDPAPAIQLAKWLVMDADEALKEIRHNFPDTPSLYWLVCVDDLARLGEIERLTGVKIPLEMQYFPAVQDLHAQIKEVRRWANEKGVGTNYLVQPVNGGGVRAWRVSSAAGSNQLLIRLLPFSKSVETPLDGIQLVYQSSWGAYISVYEVLHASP